MALAVTAVDTAPDPSAPRPTLSELFQAHAAFVWRVVAAHGVPEADVQDVTQEVFLVAFRRLDEWDPSRGSATTWLYGIAIRIAANHRRRSHVRREQAGEIPDRSVEQDPGDAIDRDRMLARLDAVLAAMDAPKREVFVLFEIAQLSMHEVAAAVGCPLKTAYKRLYAARREVGDRLGTTEGGSR